jgi:Fe-S-cluster containining protein
MNNLEASVKNTKQKYREIFLSMVDAISSRVDELKPDGLEDIFETYEAGSAGAKWQAAALDMFENDIAREVNRKWKEILAYRENFSCVGCGTCCRLACSEFSPETLKQKAQQGDNFATQFTNTFVPYQTREQAREVYPEYLELLKDTLDEEVNFYHCPKLTTGLRCSDYENRAQICRDFPDNPLSILPTNCGFYPWREEVQPVALMLHATLEIINYYKEKIEIRN